MNEDQSTIVDLETRVRNESKSALDLLIREGAQRMLQEAVELEIAEYIEVMRHLKDEQGRRLVVRNGRLPDRKIATGAGQLNVSKPRVDDRRVGKRFTSKILPPYMRRSPTIDALIPVLYLKGISTGDFGEALEAILGEGASGLSPANIVRLKEGWQQEYEAWSKRDLTGKRYVYLWVDGIYFNVRLTDDRPCMLVIMGTTPEGKKELVGLLDGERESKLSWKELLLHLKRRGLRDAPQLAVADGALGFWPALEEVFPGTREQRCWVHKTANVLDKLPKRIQPAAPDVPVRDQARGARSLRRLHGALPGQIPQGVRVPREGQAGPFHLLRLPGRSLAAPENDESDRVDVCNRAAPHTPDERLRLAHGDAHDGL